MLDALALLQKESQQILGLQQQCMQAWQQLQQHVQDLQGMAAGSPPRAAIATPHFEGVDQVHLQPNMPSTQGQILLNQESFGSLNNREVIGAAQQVTSGQGVPEPAFGSATVTMAKAAGDDQLSEHMQQLQSSIEASLLMISKKMSNIE